MKTKNLLNILFLMATALGCLTLSSCGDDGDSSDVGSGSGAGSGSNGNTPKLESVSDLQGIWTTNDDNNNDLFVFNPDLTGAYYFTYDNEENGAETSAFTYQFNSADKTLIMTATDNDKSVVKMSLSILANGNLLMRQEDGGSYSKQFKKLDAMPDISSKAVTNTFLLKCNVYNVFSYPRSYENILVYNYDFADNSIKLTCDADWVHFDDLHETGEKDYTSIGMGKFIEMFTQCTFEKNYTDEERYANITATRMSTGESQTFTITQAAYCTIRVPDAEDYSSWFNTGGSDGNTAFIISVESYDSKPVYLYQTDSWVKNVSKTERSVIGDGGGEYAYNFSITQNKGYDRSMQLVFYKYNKNNKLETAVVTLNQRGLRGPEGGLQGDGNCIWCHGTGKCRTCLGRKEIPYGNGYIECWNCFGKGVCYVCDGTGWIESALIDGTISDGGSSTTTTVVPTTTTDRCKWCLGRKVCQGYLGQHSTCHGSGKCSTCSGKGWYYGTGKDSKIMCPNCDSPGKRNSPGNGKCSWCHGTGKCLHCM